MVTNLSSLYPLQRHNAVRKRFERVCREILATGFDIWRLRQIVESLAARLAVFEHDKAKNTCE